MTRTAYALVLLLAATADSRAASVRYDGDGQLSGRLEAQRWWLNRIRFASELEADRLGLVNSTPGGSPNYDVCEDGPGGNSFGTSSNQWTAWTQSMPPLATHTPMIAAAQKHSQDMLGAGLLSAGSSTSNYYPLGSTMFQRQIREGYTNQVTGFFLNLGSISGAGTLSMIQSLWFQDTGAAGRPNRKAQLNMLAREMGVGEATNASQKYWSQDFGRTGSNAFFTCSLFNDTNGDRIYTAGEGVTGVIVRLYQRGQEAPWHDVSGSAGGFAVPLWGLVTNEPVQVVLVNTATGPVTRTLAYDCGSLGTVLLKEGKEQVIGIFTPSSTARNYGLRHLVPWTEPATVTPGTGGVEVSFSAWQGIPFQMESSDSLASANWLPFAGGTFTTQTIRVTDTGQAGRPRRRASRRASTACDSRRTTDLVNISSNTARPRRLPIVRSTAVPRRGQSVEFSKVERSRGPAVREAPHSRIDWSAGDMEG